MIQWEEVRYDAIEARQSLCAQASSAQALCGEAAVAVSEGSLAQSKPAKPKGQAKLQIPTPPSDIITILKKV